MIFGKTQNRCVNGFPGLDCPGLIEACPPLPWRQPQPCFPGLDCPGLIEAFSGYSISPSYAPVFRGLIAPASLKLLSHLPEQYRWDVFRGLIAPASLKRVGLCWVRRRVNRFPGLDCPGLIEATGTKRPPTGITTFSGA